MPKNKNQKKKNKNQNQKSQKKPKKIPVKNNYLEIFRKKKVVDINYIISEYKDVQFTP